MDVVVADNHRGGPDDLRDGAAAAGAMTPSLRGRVNSILVEADAISTEVSERKLSAAEIAYLPGTNGDVVKVVQNLPGVSRPPLGTGNLIIRGTSPEDSAAYLDGSRIPVVFHFGGLTTVINGNLLEEVSFVPGNASARYGRFLGGMVSCAPSPTRPPASTARRRSTSTRRRSSSRAPSRRTPA